MTNWAAVWAVFAGGIAAGALMTKVAPALPAIRGELGLTLVESGFAQTMMYAIGALLGVFGGAFADRFGPKRFALIGLALMTTGGLAGAAAGSYHTLLLSRFLEGCGFILMAVSAAPLLVAATRPQDRASAFGLWSCYMPVGGTLALLVAPLALAAFGWRTLWLGVAAFTALCAILIARTVPAPGFSGQIASMRLLAESLARPGALALCLAFFCYVGQWTSLMTWLPTFVVDERGASESRASMVTAAFVAINIAGNLLGGLLLRMGVPRWRLLAGGALAMGLTSTGFYLDGPPDAARFAFVLAFSLLSGVIPASVFSGAPVHARSAAHTGTTNGMVMQASHISQLSMPVAMAWIASRFDGWGASLGLMLALAAIGFAAACAIRPLENALRP